MSSPAVIQAKNLIKKYDDKTVVDRVSFEVNQGECFGILGPNGAGKSTIMKMMYCSALVDNGELYVLDLNVKKNFREIKSRIGVVPQDDGLDTDLNVFENILVFASYHGLSKDESQTRAKQLLRMMHLDEYATRQVETLSGGMKRRLAIARGLVNKPDLLFLDEPTTGLDPQARLWMWDFFNNKKREKSTVVLTTHYMEEAEVLCDRIAVIDDGKILAIGTPQELIRHHIGREVVEFETNPVDLNYYLGRLKTSGFGYQVVKNTVQILVQENQEGKQALELFTSDRITLRRPTLNDVFLKLAGHELRDEA
jgi:lipooligosaccharide transport system ATP-binding protein